MANRRLLIPFLMPLFFSWIARRHSGDKVEREALCDRLTTETRANGPPFDILLTHYELVIKDEVLKLHAPAPHMLHRRCTSPP